MWRDPMDELIEDLERIVPPEAESIPQPPPFAETQYWIARIVRCSGSSSLTDIRR